MSLIENAIPKCHCFNFTHTLVKQPSIDPSLEITMMGGDWVVADAYM